LYKEEKSSLSLLPFCEQSREFGLVLLSLPFFFGVVFLFRVFLILQATLLRTGEGENHQEDLGVRGDLTNETCPDHFFPQPAFSPLRKQGKILKVKNATDMILKEFWSTQSSPPAFPLRTTSLHL
jgi:hypothetical protein